MRKCAGCAACLDGKDPNYPGLCANCAWRKWLKSADPDGFWNSVECIECELGRDCVKHPSTEASPK